jgi:hypothetical protein
MVVVVVASSLYTPRDKLFVTSLQGTANERLSSVVVCGSRVRWNPIVPITNAQPATLGFR